MIDKKSNILAIIIKIPLYIHTGDSVVHLLTREARERYQLEQLWTLGHHYDDQYQNMERISLESDALK